MKARSLASNTDLPRAAYAGAVVATIGVAALYILTLAPTTQFWDTSEYIATAHILGIPHPPGNPLFVLLARAWEVLLEPSGLSVAVRINLFSAVMSALAHGLWFLVVYRVLSRQGGDRLFPLVGAATAVLVSATAFTVWNQSNVNEKVYTVSLFTIALLSWLALCWRARVGRPGADNLLLLIAFVLALSVGNHLMAFLAAPALLIFVLLVQPRSLASWKLHGAGLSAVVLGLTVHLFLPIRAAQAPVINQNDPTCESLGSAVTSVVTMGRRGCAELSSSLKRQQYQKPKLQHDPVAGFFGQVRPRTAKMVVAQVANYFQYFDWQWARSVAGYRSWFGGARPLFTMLFIVLGVWGAAAHYRRDRISWAYMVTLFATLSLGLVWYMNFRYGFSFPSVPDLSAQGIAEVREVRERDYFFIAGFSLWGLWAGLGIAALWHATATRLGGRRAPLLALPVLALAVMPLVTNWSWATRANDHVARDWAYNMLMSVEPYGVLFTNGDNDTFPLWYAQEVEGVRRDVTVIVTSYLATPWYVKQIRALTQPCPPGVHAEDDPTRTICQRRYDADVPLYSDLARPPEDSVVQLTDQQIEQFASTAFVTDEPLRLRASRLETTVPAGTVFTPSDTFLTAIIAATLGERPIHFVAPSPALETLALRNFAVRTGLTVRLNDGPVEADGERVVELMPGQLSFAIGRYLDLPRTDTLARDVFIYRGVPEEARVWADSATGNIPPNYGAMHLALAQAYGQRGEEDASAYHLSRARRWLTLAAPED